MRAAAAPHPCPAQQLRLVQQHSALHCARLVTPLTQPVSIQSLQMSASGGPQIPPQMRLSRSERLQPKMRLTIRASAP